MSSVSLDSFGSFEVHLGLLEVGEDADKILEECMSQYKEKYPEVNIEEDVYYDFRIIYNINLACEPEFCLCVYIWQKKYENAQNDYCEVYDGIPLEFDEESKQKVKKIMWKKFEETFFE